MKKVSRRKTACAKNLCCVLTALSLLLCLVGCNSNSCYICGKQGAANAVNGAKVYYLCDKHYRDLLISQTTEDSDTTTGFSSSEEMGENNALNKAQSYLNSSAFSYKGLIEQLEYEGFTYSEAVYGADNCGADWNGQALEKARVYLDSSSFSCKGLIEQLEYEGFTTAQATYGVNNCGADWEDQAAKKAKAYLESSPFSRSELIEQLEYEGFSHSQAVYGVEQNGY